MPRSNQPAGTREAAAVRRERAVQLRAAGHTYREIAETLGVSAAQAYADVTRALCEINKRTEEDAEGLRALEEARLDVAFRAIADQVENGDLEAVGRWVRLSESRRKLLGIDAPERKNVTFTNPVKFIAGVEEEDL